MSKLKMQVSMLWIEKEWYCSSSHAIISYLCSLNGISSWAGAVIETSYGTNSFKPLDKGLKKFEHNSQSGAQLRDSVRCGEGSLPHSAWMDEQPIKRSSTCAGRLRPAQQARQLSRWSLPTYKPRTTMSLYLSTSCRSPALLYSSPSSSAKSVVEQSN